MPHKKPHNSNNSKKKGKNKKGRSNNNNASNRSNTANGGPPSSSRSSHLKALQSIGNLPTFGGERRKVTPLNDGDATSTQKDEEEPVGGCYETYKAATTRFWDWMKRQQEQTLKNNNKMSSVNDLRRGVEQILEQTIAYVENPSGNDYNEDAVDGTSSPSSPPYVLAPGDIITDLSTSIRYREIFTSTRFGNADGGDAGHSYMIEVLKYCRSVLKFGRRVAKATWLKQQQQKKKKHEEEAAAVSVADDDDHDKEVLTDDTQVDALGGRFNALLNLHEGEEEEDDDDEEALVEAVEKDIRERNFPSYSGPEVQEDVDIEEVLINGDDRFQAMALLHTIDDYMGIIDNHYGLLKNVLRAKGGGQGGACAGHEGNSILQLLMECTVAANMATESVQAAENSLEVNHPHLSSFYHVLSLVFLPQLIADVDKLIDHKVAVESHLALQFVAEIVECFFHNRGDRRIPVIVKQYAKKMNVAVNVLDFEAQKICKLTGMEVQLAQEERLQTHLNAQMRALGVHPHMWLQRSPYIGGDRSILNTQKIIQMLMDILQDSNTKLVGRPGFWGEIFDENNSPARILRGGLDEPFGSAIMPELLELCLHAPFQSLPDRSHLITVLDLLQQHVKGNRTKPVPVALTFGLHGLLTSIYVLQGNGDLARLASYAKQSFNTLFDQLDELAEPSRPTQNAPIFYQNLALWKQIRYFAKPLEATAGPNLVAVDPAYSEKLAIWNPLIGGEYMLYATYMCSIGLGSATVDSLGQLRFTLHLYNALKHHDPSLKEVPFLKMLDKVFANTRAVWLGSKPERGSFSKRFWMAWGMSESKAAQMASERVADENGFRRGFTDHRSNDLRELEEINPDDISASHRRLVQHNFSDKEGQALYTVQNDSIALRKKYGQVLDTIARINATRDAMDDDEDSVIPVNFSAVGCILLEFVNSLSDDMGWTEIVNQTLQNNPQVRTGKTMGGNRLKGFTASDLNFKFQGLAHFWGCVLSHLDKGEMPSGVSKIAFAMKVFFGKVQKERYTFFVEKEEKLKRRNPLEGSYPHGSTGRSPRDPLQAIPHFKRNKRGQPSMRMVTPGKLAPPGGGDGGIYEGPSKLSRGPSGKFRHIANYSLDELLELGWDGSKYVSTRANHSANGHYVPFIPGYDSDSDDEYEPINIQQGMRAGTIGLSRDQIGLYMLVPDPRNPSGAQQLVKIQDPKGRSRRGN